MLLDKVVGIPAVAELLAYRDGYRRECPDGFVNLLVFRPHDVFDKIRLHLFEGLTDFDAFGSVETGVQIHRPLAAPAHRRIDSFAELDGFLGVVVKIERVFAAAARGSNPVGTQTGFDAILGASFLRFCFRSPEPGRVTFDVLARRPAEEFVDGHTQGLAFEIPERHIQGTLRVEFFPAGRIKHPPVEVLPDVLDAERVFANHHLGALLDHILGAALANADNAAVGFDLDNAASLIKKRFVVAGGGVVPDFGNFQLGHGGF